MSHSLKLYLSPEFHIKSIKKEKGKPSPNQLYKVLIFYPNVQIKNQTAQESFVYINTWNLRNNFINVSDFCFKKVSLILPDSFRTRLDHRLVSFRCMLSVFQVSDINKTHVCCQCSKFQTLTKPKTILVKQTMKYSLLALLRWFKIHFFHFDVNLWNTFLSTPRSYARMWRVQIFCFKNASSTATGFNTQPKIKSLGVFCDATYMKSTRIIRLKNCT